MNPTADSEWWDAVNATAERVAEEGNTDVILFTGGVDPGCSERVIDLVSSQSNRPRAILILVTFGGSADAAYRIARCLQDTYEHFSLYVTGLCKSAGTLVALGANELIIGPHGEMGPLDVQMRKADELWERSSGLTVVEAMTNLEQRALMTFMEGFEALKEGSGGQITTRTAIEAAATLTTGLFRPIYEQIDPMHVGEAWRATMVAQDYGVRLARIGQNTDANGITQLTTGYPSHEFVIDHGEARDLFFSVREPTQAEAELADALGKLARMPVDPYRNEVRYLGSKPDQTAHQGEEGADSGEHGAGPPAGPAGAIAPSEGSRQIADEAPEGSRDGSATSTRAGSNGSESGGRTGRVRA